MITASGRLVSSVTAMFRRRDHGIDYKQESNPSEPEKLYRICAHGSPHTMQAVWQFTYNQTMAPTTSRRETWRAPIVAMWLAFAACAPSLGSVKATAGLGTGLSQYESAFDLAATYCRFADLGGTPDPQCAALAADQANWHQVNRALVGYAAALAAMADDSKDQSQQTTIATALGASAQIGKSWSDALNKDVTSGISQGVATLIHAIDGVYRRERLARTIKASADALTAVARGIDDNIALLDRAAANLATTLTDTLSSIQLGNGPAADRLGLAFSLSSVQIALATHRATLAAYKAAVDAFAKAHKTLNDGLGGLGDKQADLELSKLIANDVKQIVESSRAVMSSTPAK